MSDESLSPFFSENEDLDINFNLEHIYLPSDTQHFLNSIPFSSNDHIPDSLIFDHDVFDEYSHVEVSDFLNIPSPDSQNSVSNDLLCDSVSPDLVNLNSENSESENFGGKSVDLKNIGGKGIDSENLSADLILSKKSVSLDLVNDSKNGERVDFEKFGGERVDSENSALNDSENFGGKKVDLDKYGGKKVDLEKFGGKSVDSEKLGGERVDSEKFVLNGSISGKRVKLENFGGKSVDLEKFGSKKVDSEKFGGKRVDSENFGGKRVNLEKFVSPVTDLLNDTTSSKRVDLENSVSNDLKSGKRVNSENSVSRVADSVEHSISGIKVDSENSVLHNSISGKQVDSENSGSNNSISGKKVGSENSGSNGSISGKRVDSENSLSPVSNLSNNSVTPAQDLVKEADTGEVDQKIKVEGGSDNLVLKRKKVGENSDLSEARTSKYRKPNYDLKKGREKSLYSEAGTSKYRKPSEREIFDEKPGKSSENSDYSSRFSKMNDAENGTNGNMDVDEKRKVRLIRNRESAQLSRQRKKHYVEELEDRVRLMHSTIVDLNNRVSYVMAENASLRQQVTGGMYPPWVPCPPYMVKPQGSQVPLVPIPRLKVKKSESKSRTKKVASVSLLGLLFFMMLFGGLIPMMNVKFREMNESVSGGLDYLNNSVSYYRQKGRVLTSVNGSDKDIGIGIENDFIRKGCFGKTKPDGEKGGGNSSEPLVASLFVPRNDKLVKIDGNLIIHSVMASEKAMASNRNEEVKSSEETGLAVSHNTLPSIIPLTGNNRNPQPYRGPAERQKALGGEKDKLIPADGKLQQWFKEGLAGPMLSSGMCTEVFQFDVSPTPGAIVAATSAVNVSSEIQHRKNITRKGNRRILHGIPVPLGSESNITEKPAGIDPEKNKFGGNSSLSSMVVSVLVDPREAGDGNGDGVMGPKSISRIFVVVLTDSVKYVTYSCMLPLIGSGAHLVTT